MNRLTDIYLGNTHSHIVYDPLGRMTDKQADGQTVFANASFAGAPVPPRPHALKSAESPDGIFPAARQDITYTSFDKVSTIAEGDNTLAYTYGYDQQRIRMVQTVGGITQSKDYVGLCEFITENVGENETAMSLTYLVGPYGVFAVVVRQDDDESVHYILKDHLGSWTTITDSEGNVEQELSFDAWGSLRDPETWTGSFSGSPMFDRGYTGHEHMTAFGLINMNGRCYDPLTSSFLSVDAYVEDPANAQAFNRYAYCGYNPLRYTDPTGWYRDNCVYQPMFGCDPPFTQWYSNDPNDVLWGRTVHPCANSSSGYVNGIPYTGTSYSQGNHGLKSGSYVVDKQGYIKQVEINDNSYDIIYTQESWDNGDKDCYMEIPLGVLTGKKTTCAEGKNGILYTFDLYTIHDNEKSTEFFEFLAANTNVEWSQTFVGTPGNNTSIISTTHDISTEAGQGYLLQYGWTIIAHNHSHPYNESPSASDLSWAKAVHEQFPNVELKIYYKNHYYEYDEYGPLMIHDYRSNLIDNVKIIDTRIIR